MPSVVVFASPDVRGVSASAAGGFTPPSRFEVAARKARARRVLLADVWTTEVMLVPILSNLVENGDIMAMWSWWHGDTETSGCICNPVQFSIGDQLNEDLMVKWVGSRKRSRVLIGGQWSIVTSNTFLHIEQTVKVISHMAIMWTALQETRGTCVWIVGMRKETFHHSRGSLAF